MLYRLHKFKEIIQVSGLMRIHFESSVLLQVLPFDVYKNVGKTNSVEETHLAIHIHTVLCTYISSSIRQSFFILNFP